MNATGYNEQYEYERTCWAMNQNLKANRTAVLMSFDVELGGRIVAAIPPTKSRVISHDKVGEQT